MTEPEADSFIDVATPIGFAVRCSHAWWDHIVSIKHPVMRQREDLVVAALRHPVQVRRSRRDSAVYLFYAVEREGRWTCAVVRRENGSGFLITAYPTDAIKEGDPVWPV